MFKAIKTHLTQSKSNSAVDEGTAEKSMQQLAQSNTTTKINSDILSTKTKVRLVASSGQSIRTQKMIQETMEFSFIVD
jgi:hypothetical protein